MYENIYLAAIEFIEALLATGIIAYYFNKVFERKYSVKICVMLYLLLFVAFFAANIFIIVPAARLAVKTGLSVFIMVFLYSKDTPNKVFLGLIYVIITLVSELLPIILIELSFGLKISEMLPGGLVRLAGIVSAKILCFCLLLLILKILSLIKEKLISIPLKNEILICSVPVISIIIMYSIIMMMQKSDFSRFYMLIFLLSILYMNIAVLYFIDSYSGHTKLAIMTELLENEKENYKLLETTWTEMRRINHDIGNHMLIIKALLRQGETDKALEYTESLRSQGENMIMVTYTGNPTIDSILNIKGMEAKNHGIVFLVTAELNAEILIDAISICIILGNALDNAIEACNRIEDPEREKYVHVRLAQGGRHIIISVTNTFDQSEGHYAKSLRTIKKDKSMNGFGIKNIQETVRKYNGMFSHDMKDGIFILNIMLENISGDSIRAE